MKKPIESSILIKKSGKFFKSGTSQQAVTNHIRTIYDNIEQAYISEYGINEIPLCDICNKRPKRFTSFFKGYSRHCGHEDCTKSERERGCIKGLETLRVEGYDEFLLDNKDAVKSLFLEKKPFHDEFTGRIHKNTRFLKLHSESGLLSEQFLEDRACEVCGTTFQNYFYSDSHICSKKCKKRKASYAAKYSKQIKSKNRIAEKVKELEKLSYLEFSKLCNSIEFRQQIPPHILSKLDEKRQYIYKSFRNAIDCFFEERLNLYCAVIKSRTKYRNHTAHILYQQGLLTEIEIDSFSEKDSCKSCGSDVFYKPNFLIDSKFNYFTLKTSKYSFCDENCYFSALRQGKERLYGEYNEDTKMRQSIYIKEKIKNGDFTPKSNNRRTHWFTIDGKNWRSSWEYAFWVYCEFKKIPILYESTRLEYKSLKSENTRIYIVDFTDEASKILYEVGPKELKNTPNELAKINAAKQWCLDNNYSFELIDETFFEGLQDDVKRYIISRSDSEKLTKKLKDLLKYYE